MLQLPPALKQIVTIENIFLFWHIFVFTLEALRNKVDYKPHLPPILPRAGKKKENCCKHCTSLKPWSDSTPVLKSLFCLWSRSVITITHSNKPFQVIHLKSNGMTNLHFTSHMSHILGPASQFGTEFFFWRHSCHNFISALILGP